MRKLFDCCWSAEPIWKQGVGGVGWYGDHWWPETVSVPKSYGENMLPESFDSEIPTFTDSKICQQKESASSKIWRIV